MTADIEKLIKEMHTAYQHNQLSVLYGLAVAIITKQGAKINQLTPKEPVAFFERDSDGRLVAHCGHENTLKSNAVFNRAYCPKCNTEVTYSEVA